MSDVSVIGLGAMARRSRSRGAAVAMWTDEALHIALIASAP
jgi:hypothetical protein